MAHLHIADKATQLTDSLRSQRVLRVLVWILIPIAIWTLGALVWLWPHDTAAHIRADNTTRAVPGMSIVNGTVTDVTQINCDGVTGSATGDRSRCARLDVRVDEGPEAGSTQQMVVTAAVYASGISDGQKVRLYRTPIDKAPAAYQFADFQRTVPMVALALLFVGVVVAVARWRGLIAVGGLLFAGFIMTQFMFPALIEGRDPVLVGLVGSTAIMFVTLYSAHGVSARTTTALIGTLFGLFLCAFLGWVATVAAHLSGVASEDDFVLAASAPDLRLTSVVICGVIIASMGVLNDVTITQASAVWELASGKDDARALFSKAMRIGRDHIASSVYTTAFASAGAVLSVLLLLVVYERPLFGMLATEQFAGEVVRTLVASIGLVLAVPLTTLVAVMLVRGGFSKTPDELGEVTVFNPDDRLIDIDADR